jgi:hypothetical protein
MTIENMFNEIYRFVRKDQNFIPRNYQTIGGGWTVDTWKLNDVTVQLMDDGYTTVIFNENVYVYQTCTNPLVFTKGDEENLKNIYLELLQK